MTLKAPPTPPAPQPTPPLQHPLPLLHCQQQGGGAAADAAERALWLGPGPRQPPRLCSADPPQPAQDPGPTVRGWVGESRGNQGGNMPPLPSHPPAPPPPPACSEVAARPAAQGATLHFVDDRYETLEVGAHGEGAREGGGARCTRVRKVPMTLRPLPSHTPPPHPNESTRRWCGRPQTWRHGTACTSPTGGTTPRRKGRPRRRCRACGCWGCEISGSCCGEGGLG